MRGILQVRRLSAVMLGPAALLLGLTLAGCTRYVTVERLPQAYYQTAYPDRDVAGALEEVFQAVKRIRVTGFYDHFRFSPDSAPREGDRLGLDVLARAVDTFSSSTSREASAVQVAKASLRATLLTNHHAIQFPDTVVEYEQVVEERGAPQGRRIIRGISIKRSQFNMVVDRDGLRAFDILATDPTADLALLGVVYPTDADSRNLAVVPVRAGDSDRLSWGSFVFVLGYPGGYPMVTRGIVSDPERGASSSFLIDGLWNEGTSGGPILAVRGEDGSLEWVGIARAAAGRTEHRLTPDPEFTPSRDQRALYEGQVYLEEVQRILYGISLSVPMTAIRAFMGRNRSSLGSRGWPLPVF